ncbi:hypothetical protein [Algivirga pacifica]|uniref:Uncharacterized protein n=1 Tax=Algivirga pacifica TaxID=1162670 RepID=A0ABP9DR45_9BACT
MKTMNSEFFLKELFKLKPDLVKLKGAIKADDETAISLQQQWYIPLEGVKKTKLDNPIEDLVTHQLSKVLSISNLSIDHELLITPEFKIFGGIFTYGLSLSIKDERIYLVNLETFEILFECSETASKFLELILIFIDFRAREWEGYLFSSKETNEYISKATDIAGGTQYYNFVKYLFDYV